MKFVNNLENVFEKYEKYLGGIFSKGSTSKLKLKKVASKLESKKSESNLKPEKESQDIENTANWESKSNTTRVFEKFDLKPHLDLKPDMIKATITVVDGLDESSKAEFADVRVNIGRRPSNELVLNDVNSSRLHAYIVPQEGSHVIYDAQSLNGTYVNGELIISRKLTNGDKIKIGNTVILYTIN